MADQIESSQPQAQEQKNDKEYNFRALEAKYQRELQTERSARLEAEKMAQEAKKAPQQEEEDDSEPYVDHKRLSRTLNSFEKRLEDKIDKKAEEKAHGFIQKEKRENWLRTNNDFYDVLQHAEKLYQTNPELAETILEMPEGFERQKLVYNNIKSLGLHKPQEKKPSIQEKVDANRRGPYYQPSGVGAAPYASQADFSPSGQKQAHDKMQELKNRLRLG